MNDYNISKYHDVYEYDTFNGKVIIMGTWLEAPQIRIEGEDEKDIYYELRDELRWHFNELEEAGKEIPKPVTEYQYFKGKIETRNDVMILEAKLNNISSQLFQLGEDREDRIKYRSALYNFLAELRVALGI